MKQEISPRPSDLAIFMVSDHPQISLSGPAVSSSTLLSSRPANKVANNDSSCHRQSAFIILSHLIMMLIKK